MEGLPSMTPVFATEKGQGSVKMGHKGCAMHYDVMARDTGNRTPEYQEILKFVYLQKDARHECRPKAGSGCCATVGFCDSTAMFGDEQTSKIKIS